MVVQCPMELSLTPFFFPFLLCFFVFLYSFFRTGITPDSQGKEVYYYVVSNRAPFTLGCFGPINTEAECRALYPECDGVSESFTTAHGTDDYDLDCPCFNPATGGNMPGQGKPKFLGLNGFDAFQLDLMEGDRSCNDKDGTSRPCNQEEKDAVKALYSSQKCGSGSGNSPSSSMDTTDVTTTGDQIDPMKDMGTTSGSVTPTDTNTASDPRQFCGHGTYFDDITNRCEASYQSFIESCTTDPTHLLCGNHKDECGNGIGAGSGTDAGAGAVVGGQDNNMHDGGT